MKKIIFLCLLFLCSQFSILNSQTIRPVKDSIGFCWNAEEMNRFMFFLDKHTEHNKVPSQNLIAAISVHDDYLYAGKVYYPLYKLIKTKEVVIFGVTHGAVRKEMGVMRDEIILDEFDEWCAPYSNIKKSPLREIIRAKLERSEYVISNKAHSLEHSIEALIPFLQYYNRDIKITPIMVTQMSSERTAKISDDLSKIISDYVKKNKLMMGKDIFFLISNDANHYGEDFNNSPFGLNLDAHKTATGNDRAIIKENLEGKITKDKMKNLFNEILPDTSAKKIIPLWCGRFPISLGIQTVNKIVNEMNGKSLYGKLFKYSDSMTEKVLPFENTGMGLTAIFSPKHWCGWFTLGFYLK